LRWGTKSSESNLKDAVSVDCDWFESLDPMELKLPDDDDQWPDLFI